MDTRRLIVGFLAAMAAFYVWTVIASYIWPRPPVTTQPVASAPAEPGPAQSQPELAQTKAAAQPSTTQPALVANTTTRPAQLLIEGASTQTLTLGGADRNS